MSSEKMTTLNKTQHLHEMFPSIDRLDIYNELRKNDWILEDSIDGLLKLSGNPGNKTLCETNLNALYETKEQQSQNSETIEHVENTKMNTTNMNGDISTNNIEWHEKLLQEKEQEIVALKAQLKTHEQSEEQQQYGEKNIVHQIEITSEDLFSGIEQLVLQTVGSLQKEMCASLVDEIQNKNLCVSKNKLQQSIEKIQIQTITMAKKMIQDIRVEIVLKCDAVKTEIMPEIQEKLVDISNTIREEIKNMIQKFTQQCTKTILLAKANRLTIENNDNKSEKREPLYYLKNIGQKLCKSTNNNIAEL